ncbi:MAG: TolC family protein [Gemmataceae bacterium]
MVQSPYRGQCREMACLLARKSLALNWDLARLVVGEAAVAAVIAGCSLTPAGTGEEQAKLALAGAEYENTAASRDLPDLPARPTWRDLLLRAFLANGDLEKNYFDWKAALERVGVASAYPNTNLALGYSYTFSRERMKSFDRMMFSAAFDSMENLSSPAKVAQAGKAALAEAKATGERFRAAKFDLQRRVLVAWADYALLAEKVGLAQDELALSGGARESAAARVRAGGPQQDLLKAEVAYRLAHNALHGREAALAAARAGLNGLLAREPGAPLPPPDSPESRPVPPDDAKLLALGVEKNPELAELASRVQGRADALELARLQWLPDVNPSLAFTGGAAQAIAAAVVLPTTVGEIRGRIREAEAELRSAEAALRQLGRDRASAFVAAVVALRNAGREAALLERQLLPLAEQVVGVSKEAYVSGSASYLDLIESQRTLLGVRLAAAEARASREKRLAELEALAGTDIESIASAGGGAGGKDASRDTPPPGLSEKERL